MNLKTIKYYLINDKGLLREEQQDNYWCDDEYIDVSTNKSENVLSGTLPLSDHCDFAVFDGVGGMEGGRQASFYAAESFSKNRLQYDVTDMYKQMNRDVYMNAAQAGVRGAATTAAVVNVGQDNVIVSNVGDSKIFLFRDNALRQLSEDHSIGNCLYQYVGMNELKEKIRPSEKHMDMRPDDVYILCTDGITKHVDIIELEQCIRDSKKEGIVDGGQFSQHIKQTVLNRGAEDNFTMITICL